MLSSNLFSEDSRLKLTDFLLQKGLLVKGPWFQDANGTFINGYKKGSPIDPLVSISLSEFGVDIEEYKGALNTNGAKKRLLDGKTMACSFLFSNKLKERIETDEWFKDHFELDEKLIYISEELQSTSPSFQIDQFNYQQKQKVQRSMNRKRKQVDELQKEISTIYGRQIPVKRQRKSKTREE